MWLVKNASPPDDKRAGAKFSDLCENRIEFPFGSSIQDVKLEPKLLGRRPRSTQLRLG